MKRELKAICVVIKNEEKFFVAKDNDPDDFINFWEFPGGHMENIETMEEAAKRQIKKKLGIEIEEIEELCSSTNDFGSFSMTVVACLCKAKSEPKLVTYDEGKFVTINELAKLKFTPAHYEVIGELIIRFAK